MTKKILWGIIAVLLITNIATLFFMDNGDTIVMNENDEESVINEDEPVASIQDNEITYAEWMAALRESYGEQQLRSMVDRTLVNELAEEKNIEIDEKVIARDIAYLTSMQGPLTEDELADEKEKWEEEAIYRYQLEFLLTEDFSIPEEEAEAYYRDYQDQYDFSAAMQLSHIVVQNMETAEQVYDELEAGASFSLLAEEYSLDEETKDIGGYLGFINTNSQFFPNGYEEVANDLENHTYSEPFAADTGITIIYLQQNLPAIEFTYDEIAPYVKNELALHNEGISLNTNPLLETADIDWIYSSENEDNNF